MIGDLVAKGGSLRDGLDDQAAADVLWVLIDAGLFYLLVHRRDWTPERRAEELRHWTQIIESPDYAVRIWRDVLPDLGDRLLCQSLQEQRREFVAAHEAALAREQTLRAAEHNAFVARIRGLEGALAVNSRSPARS